MLLLFITVLVAIAATCAYYFCVEQQLRLFGMLFVITCFLFRGCNKQNTKTCSGVLNCCFSKEQYDEFSALFSCVGVHLVLLMTFHRVKTISKLREDEHLNSRVLQNHWKPSTFVESCWIMNEWDQRKLTFLDVLNAKLSLL